MISVPGTQRLVNIGRQIAAQFGLISIRTFESEVLFVAAKYFTNCSKVKLRRQVGGDSESHNLRRIQRRPVAPLIESDSLLSRLRTANIGKSLLIIDECTSTSDIAAELANEGAPHGFTVLGERQTKGRGRQGRTWFSPRGGIWMSIVLRPPQSFEPLDSIPLISALAIAKAINEIHGLRTSVRWPNDVILNNQKLAGTLVETKLTGNTLQYLVLGLGVNANFPSSMLTGTVRNATTLSDSLGHTVDREELAVRILFELEDLYEHVHARLYLEVLEFLRQNDCSRGKEVVIGLEKELIRGVFEDYSTLTTVQIVDQHVVRRQVQTSSVVSVAYLGA